MFVPIQWGNGNLVKVGSFSVLKDLYEMETVGTNWLIVKRGYL